MGGARVGRGYGVFGREEKESVAAEAWVGAFSREGVGVFSILGRGEERGKLLVAPFFLLYYDYDCGNITG